MTNIYCLPHKSYVPLGDNKMFYGEKASHSRFDLWLLDWKQTVKWIEAPYLRDVQAFLRIHDSDGCSLVLSDVGEAACPHLMSDGWERFIYEEASEYYK